MKIDLYIHSMDNNFAKNTNVLRNKVRLHCVNN